MLLGIVEVDAILHITMMLDMHTYILLGIVEGSKFIFNSNYT